MESLPKNLSDLIRSTTGPDMGRHVGGLYDEAEASGREFMLNEGVEVVDLIGDKADPFRTAVAPVYETQMEMTRSKFAQTDAVVAKIQKLKAEL